MEQYMLNHDVSHVIRNILNKNKLHRFSSFFLMNTLKQLILYLGDGT